MGAVSFLVLVVWIISLFFGSTPSETAIEKVKFTITASLKHRNFKSGPLEGGTAVLVNGLGAYWVNSDTVYAANGFAKTWSPGITYAKQKKVTFDSVKQAAR